jgi:diguanylate cyclase (GGDEF)-like protein
MISSGISFLITIILMPYYNIMGFQSAIHRIAVPLLNPIGGPYYNISDKIMLVWLVNLSLVFMILLGSLFFIRHLSLIRQIRKIRAAINEFCQSEVGYFVSLRQKGEIDQLVTNLITMSKKLMEIRLSYINKLKREILFQSQLLQMILSLQKNCFPEKDFHYIISSFLSMFFHEDSCTLLLQRDQEKLEIAAAWGDGQKEVRISPYECLALWEGKVHCGSICDGRFRCKFEDDISKRCICTPVSDMGLLKVVPDGGEHQLLIKKKRASLVAEHLGVILRGFKMSEDLRDRSLRDPLTGLFNRRFMEEALKLEITKAARQNNIIGVIMIDLDHFKRFNDTYGHLAGDALLKEIGLLLMNHCRSSDIVCRYGGEEFLLVISETNEDNLVKKLEQLKVKVEELRIWHIYYWLNSPTFSAGIAIYPHHGDTQEALLKSADYALYKAKEMGRNRICVAGGDQYQEIVSNACLSKQHDEIKNKVQMPDISNS